MRHAIEEMFAYSAILTVHGLAVALLAALRHCLVPVRSSCSVSVAYRYAPCACSRESLPSQAAGTTDPKQRWLTFVRNHAQAVVACGFFVVVTATFLHLVCIAGYGSRRILHHNAAVHPTTEWTVQQFRDALSGRHTYRYLIHDRASIFCKELDKEVAMEVRVFTNAGAGTRGKFTVRTFLKFVLKDMGRAFQPRKATYEPWAENPSAIKAGRGRERSSTPYSLWPRGSTRCRSRQVPARVLA